jgi:fumarate reductase flavoprotein subunit
MDAIARRLLVTWQHPENSLFADGAILVNQKGRRFCNETLSPEREIALADQSGKIGFILLDERLIDRYSRWPHFISTAPQIAYAYVADYLRLRPDVAVKARSLGELARRRRIPSEALQATVAEFNHETAHEHRPQLAGEQWVLLGPVKAYFTTTEGGAAIDEQFRVLDTEGCYIPGLYAVGQNGLGGQVLWGHGLHIAWAITSGRLVGKQLGGGSWQNSTD